MRVAKLPLDLNIIIPFDSEARTFGEVFNTVEIGKYLVKDYNRKGRNPYNPLMMLKLILFYHMEKIHSLRAMEKAVKNDIRIMRLTDNLQPSHNVISQFINEHLSSSIEDIFLEINNFLILTENIDTSKIYINGTKIESRANKYTFVWRKSYEKYLDKLQIKVSKSFTKLNDYFMYEQISFPLKGEYEVADLKTVVSFLRNTIINQNIHFLWARKDKIAFTKTF